MPRAVETGRQDYKEGYDGFHGKGRDSHLGQRGRQRLRLEPRLPREEIAARNLILKASNKTSDSGSTIRL
jgi:hypothetical protein